MNGWFRRQESGVRLARHVEIWGEIEAQNRFLRRLAIAACAWAFLALSGAAAALHIGLFQPLAFHVDLDGQATFVGRLRERTAPSEAEVRAVAKQFLQRTAAPNSLTIESDLAEAWNLMTEELRRQHEEMLAEYERRNGKEFVAFVKEQAIQTLLDWKHPRTRVTDHGGKVFTVELHGLARTWPLSRAGEGTAVSERELEAVVTLVRCPRTETTPNGLLVAKVSTRFFVAASDDAEGSEPNNPNHLPTEPTPSAEE